MKKQALSPHKTSYIKLLASMPNEKRLISALELTKFIHKLNQEGKKQNGVSGNISNLK